jgi:hypothetical protein
MRPTLALAVTAMLAISAPALAQEAGAPGAVGTGGGMTGSNNGTGFGPNGPYYGPYDNAPGVVYGPPVLDPYGPGIYAPEAPAYGYDYGYGRPLMEGRAAAPERDYADPTPRTVRGDQNGQDQAW